MKKAALFIIDGFEETEAVTVADMLRRAGADLKIISLTASLIVKGKHGITVTADAFFKEAAGGSFDMLIIPGGTIKYIEHEGLLGLVKKYNAEGKLLAAICAAPAVFGKAGILGNKKAACYPGMESYLGDGVILTKDKVVTDSNITTSRGPATSLHFALELVRILEGAAKAAQIKKDVLFEE